MLVKGFDSIKLLIGILTSFLLLFSSIAFCQEAPDTLWTATYDNDEWDIAWSVIPTSDSGFVVAGDTGSFEPDAIWEFWLMKVDCNGNLLWENKFTDTTQSAAFASSVLQISDGGFLVSGTSYPESGDYPDIRVIKTDSFGSTEWEVLIGGPLSDWCYYAANTSDDGYIFTGAQGIFPDGLDLLLVKTDSLCNVEWESTFGGSGMDLGFAVQETSDGGYIVGGDTKSFSSSNDFYIVKTDSGGNLVWELSWGSTGSGWHRIEDILQTPDGGYIAIGRSFYDGHLIKLNENGEIQWEHIFSNCTPNAFIETIDGGTVITGNQNKNLWLMRTDSLGNVVWQTLVDISSTIYCGGLAICPTNYGGYVVAGNCCPVSGMSDYSIVCFESCTGISEEESFNAGLQLYPSFPNPFRNTISTEYQQPDISDVTVFIYDTAGHIVYREELSGQPAGLYTFIWTASESLPNGCYMIDLSACGERVVRRCVKLN